MVWNLPNSKLALNSNRGNSRTGDPTVMLFWLFVVFHVVAYTLVCVLTQPNLPLDAVEMIYWGQSWQLGYHKHPPLPSWIAAACWHLSGHGSWGIYLVCQLTIVATFWAVWQFAREALNPWVALCSVGVLEGCYYLNFLSADFNNTIVSRPMWALTVLFLYRAITRQSARTSLLYWCLTGVAIGLGMLSKYYVGVVVLCLLTVPVFLPSTRRHLRTPGPYLTALVAMLIFAPHLAWMVNNEFVTLSYVVDRSSNVGGESSINLLKHLTEPVEFLLSQIGAVIPVLALLVPLILVKKSKDGTSIFRCKSESKTDEAFFNRYLLIAFMGPLVFYVAVSLIFGINIRSKWGGPLFSFLGVFVLSRYAGCFTRPNAVLVLRNSFAMGLLFVVVLGGRNFFGPACRGEISRIHFPGKQLAEEVHQRWNEKYSTPLTIVGGELFVSACAGVYSDSPVGIYGSMSPRVSLWMNDEQLANQGAVVVWDYDQFGNLPPDGWLDRFARVELLKPIVCSSEAWSYDKDVTIGAAIIHPKKAIPALTNAESDKLLY